jgi:hypothetical protein
MIPMQPILVDLAPSLAPVMLWMALALVGSTAVFIWQALRTTPRGRSRPAPSPALLAA